jgi:hypothetical protein
MEDAEIHRGWLERSDALPHTCFRTGQPTGGMVRKRKLVTAPAWTGVLILLGALPYILLRTAVGETVTLLIPESPENRKQRRLTVAVAILLAMVGFGLFVFGTYNKVTPVWPLGLVIIIGSIALSIWNVRAHSIGVRMKHKDPTVRLKRVYPGAAVAMPMFARK